MSNNLQTIKLRDLCAKIGSGATPKGGKESYKDQGIPLIRSQNVLMNEFSVDGLAYIDDVQADELRNVIVQPDDVLLNITGDSVARVCQAPKWICPARVNQHVAIIRPNVEMLNPTFLRYFLVSPKMQDYMLGLASSGATRQALTKLMIEDFEIPLPEKPIQDKISNVLINLDRKIELNNQINETFEAMAKAIFKEWFIDFGPVKANAEGKKPFGMDDETAALFSDSFEECELGLIPKGWVFRNLDEVMHCFDSRRIPLSGPQREIRKGPYPYYGAASLMGYIDEYIFDGIHVLMGEDGSVVNVDGTPVLQYVWGKYWVNNHAHVLKGKGISDEHLLLALKNVNISAYTTGAVQLKLNQGNMNRIPFLFAGEKINKKFSDFVAPLFEQIRHNFDENKNLISLRDLLLPKLITGEIELKDTL